MQTRLVLLITLSVLGLARVAAQDCSSSYYPMKTGAVMVLQHTDAKGKASSKTIQRVLAARPVASGFEADMEMEIVDNKDKNIGKSTYKLSCENGVFKINMRSMMGPAGSPPPGMEQARMEYLPVNMKPGQTLNDGKANMKTYMGDVKIMEMDFAMRDRKVEGREAVTTPAGTFDCVRVSSVSDFKIMGRNRAAKSVVWYAVGAGMVKQESYDDGGKLASSSVLVELKR